jgi:NADH-quinone oxidoreductase subunit M
LPLAHVEARTGASVVLAGVLLKIGGYALVKIPIFSRVRMVVCFFYLGLVIRRIACCFQNDIKRVIAYSRVAHICVIPIIVRMNVVRRINVIVMIIVFHAFRSGLLFMVCGRLYRLVGRRVVVIIRGVLVGRLLIGLIMRVRIVMNLAILPCPRFFAEVMFVNVCLND